MNRHAQSEFVWGPLRDEQCHECSLHKGVEKVCILGDGPVPCDGIIIGDAPGYREDETGIHFSGKYGVFLRQQLKEAGLDARKLFLTTVVKCRPLANVAPTRKEAKTCSALYLDKEVELVKPRVALLLGATAISWATGKKSAVLSLEGTTFESHGLICVPSRSPSAVVRVEDDDSYPYHVQAFKENLLLFKNTLYPKKDDFEFSQTFPHLESGKRVYADLESNGLNPYKPDAIVHCIGFTQSQSDLSCFKIEPEHTPQIVKTLKECPIIAHRATFEGTWLRKHYGVTPRIYHDTKLMAYLINENEPSGLKYQAIRHLGVEPWSEQQNFQNPDFNTLLPYCARDNAYGFRLYKHRDIPFLKKNPRIARLMRHIILPAMEVFIEIIHNGFHIDVEESKKRLEHCLKEQKKLNRQLNKIAGREVNPGSPLQMSRLLYDQLGLDCPVKTAKGKDSTSEAALIRLRGRHEATDILWDWRGWDKKRSTYLEPWIRQGPILHANYGFTDTDTGRLNSSMVKDKRKEKKTGAVIHQCPRDPFIRNIIVPRGYAMAEKDGTAVTVPKKTRHGWKLVAFDWSQIELRLVAHCAEEPTMMDIFNRGGDIHLATAMHVLNMEAERIDKETRKKAKAVNFGFVYGMFAPKFVLYCLEKFDLKISLKEGKDYRKGFFRKYDRLLPWHNRVKSIVQLRGEVESVFGRVRHLPQAKHDSAVDEWLKREAERQAINSPIQEAGSSLLLFLFALIGSYSLPWDWKYERDKVNPIGSAHDSGLCEVREDYVDEFKRGVKYTVDNLPIRKFFGFDFRVPIVLDVTAYQDCWEGKVLA